MLSFLACFPLQLSIPQWDIFVLDLTSLTYQPTTKSSDRSGHPKRHVIFAMSERKPACLAHALDINEDEDDKHHVRPTKKKGTA